MTEYRAVPVEPSEAMIGAFEESYYADPPYIDAKTAWHAMLSAAPSPPPPSPARAAMRKALEQERDEHLWRIDTYHANEEYYQREGRPRSRERDYEIIAALLLQDRVERIDAAIALDQQETP